MIYARPHLLHWLIQRPHVCVCVAWPGRRYIIMLHTAASDATAIYFLYISRSKRGRARARQENNGDRNGGGASKTSSGPGSRPGAQECASELDRSVPNKEGRGHTTSFCPLGGSSHPPLLLLGSLACSRLLNHIPPPIAEGIGKDWTIGATRL